MPPTKPYRCVECGETNPLNFYSNLKSLCKIHYGIPKTPELRKKIIKPYCCVVCGDEDESHFHSYKKTKCKKHFNTKVPSVNLETNTESEDSCSKIENRSNPVPTEDVAPKSIKIRIISRKKVE
jgi:hypothetical protein